MYVQSENQCKNNKRYGIKPISIISTEQVLIIMRNFLDKKEQPILYKPYYRCSKFIDSETKDMSNTVRGYL